MHNSYTEYSCKINCNTPYAGSMQGYRAASGVSGRKKLVRSGINQPCRDVGGGNGSIDRRKGGRKGG